MFHTAFHHAGSTSVPRQTFREVINNEEPLQSLHRTTEINPAMPHNEKTLYTEAPQHFSYGVGLGFKQNVGGPDGLLYQFSADADAEYRFNRNTWWSGLLSVNLLNNYDGFTYDAPSGLPRVAALRFCPVPLLLERRGALPCANCSNRPAGIAALAASTKISDRSISCCCCSLFD